MIRPFLLEINDVFSMREDETLYRLVDREYNLKIYFLTDLKKREVPNSTVLFYVYFLRISYAYQY